MRSLLYFTGRFWRLLPEKEAWKMAVTISGIEPKSRAQRAGIQPGDVLVSINGHEIVDVLDYRFLKRSGSCGCPSPGMGRPIRWSW